jgi:predicted DNA-binding helix-hairpin-helix protein
LSSHLLLLSKQIYCNFFVFTEDLALSITQKFFTSYFSSLPVHTADKFSTITTAIQKKGFPMVGIISKPDTQQKLELLSTDAQYDLACACSTTKDEHRQRSSDGKWILPNGGKSILFKTLISNACSSDCKYCPLRRNIDTRRCTLSPEETAKIFMDYYTHDQVFGLFLSSGLTGSPDKAMQRLTDTVEILRNKHRFRGYIHLKVLPGAGPAAIQKAVSLSSAVSLNIETPGPDHLEKLSKTKNFLTDIIEPIKQISSLTAKGNRYQSVKQTTQFIVGASNETDAEIVKYTAALYERLKLNRIYFSAYQKGLGDSSLLAEQKQNPNPQNILTREHRLYQVDFLLRKYSFKGDEIPFEKNGRLSLETDPKQLWADNHPENFPLNINSAPRDLLLRVPGLGPITINRILKQRRQSRLHSIRDIAKPNKRLIKAEKYITF